MPWCVRTRTLISDSFKKYDVWYIISYEGLSIQFFWQTLDIRFVESTYESSLVVLDYRGLPTQPPKT